MGGDDTEKYYCNQCGRAYGIGAPPDGYTCPKLVKYLDDEKVRAHIYEDWGRDGEDEMSDRISTLVNDYKNQTGPFVCEVPEDTVYSHKVCRGKKFTKRKAPGVMVDCLDGEWLKLCSELG